MHPCTAHLCTLQQRLGSRSLLEITVSSSWAARHAASEVCRKEGVMCQIRHLRLASARCAAVEALSTANGFWVSTSLTATT